ncbi:unnamed protein product [Urochloa humidicola]
MLREDEELLARSSLAVLSMNSSRQGKTSYTNNSNVQRGIASATKAARQEMAAGGGAVPRPRPPRLHGHRRHWLRHGAQRAAPGVRRRRGRAGGGELEFEEGKG